MEIMNFAQGSEQWHAHRAQHFNASDAPAMMGCSPYETRQQLIHRLKTGISKEIDAATQRRFDDGHRFEALARPLAEKIIGEDLYPVTGTEGELSASFDGLTMAEDVAFEHKSLNRDLRTVMVDGCDGTDLPLMYRVQMEQQCMVSGCERVLFMATKWDGDELVEERHCWYESNQHLADDIATNWRQLAEDLAAYVPEVAAPKVVAQAVEALPALVVRVEGRVVSSNLDAYRKVAEARIAAVKTELTTDQDFADADATAKHFKDGAAQLKLAKQQAQAEAQDIDQVFRAIDHIVDLMDRKRIELENLVKAEKERRRGEIVADGVKGLTEHVAGLNARLGRPLMPTIGADFGGAIKGKKNLDSMRDAVSAELARAKIDASRIADQIDANLKTISAAEPATLFPDVQALVLKAPDDLAAVISSRIAAHKAAEEAKAETKPADPPVAAPAPSVTPISSTVARAVVVEQQDVISAFLASRTWGRGEEAKARAVVVEFEKFRAGYQLRKAA